MSSEPLHKTIEKQAWVPHPSDHPSLACLRRWSGVGNATTRTKNKSSKNEETKGQRYMAAEQGYMHPWRRMSRVLPLPHSRQPPNSTMAVGLIPHSLFPILPPLAARSRGDLQWTWDPSGSLVTCTVIALHVSYLPMSPPDDQAKHPRRGRCVSVCLLPRECVCVWSVLEKAGPSSSCRVQCSCSFGGSLSMRYFAAAPGT